ncbi:hypothetical protein MYMAC_004194 [Corallococcus macrosporus DSM 14697]|uniref:Uncharacterized protein n=2 Tax=Corallococcus macrosporus TaxID=35 RepID=A0A250JYK0_9BACT|nr:hypothetical protein MYMAC_004194 [Corallococcus macrosporus DSM 14697]
MGMIIFGGFILALLAAFAVASVAAVIHLLAMRKGYGSWKAFLLLGGGVTLVVGVIAVSRLNGAGGGGAPFHENYDHYLYAAALLGSAPGWGALTGLLALFKRSAPAANPRVEGRP